MDRSKFRKQKLANGGFTLIEVIFAIVVFAIGLMGLAALLAYASQGTTRSRYMGMAAYMANEKLEDLMRLSPSDPSLVVPATQTYTGSLTVDCTGTANACNGTASPYYFDDVQTSAANGSVTEIRRGVQTDGTDCVEVFTYTPTSPASNPDTCTSSNAAPAANASTIIFHRRWLVESPVTINGTSVANVRRITVQVILKTNSAGPAVTYQMSAIRS